MKRILLAIAVLAMAGIANAQQCVIDADCPGGDVCRQNPAGDGGSCVNTSTDNNNCGQVYNVCNTGSGEACINGVCECQFVDGCSGGGGGGPYQYPPGCNQFGCAKAPIKPPDIGAEMARLDKQLK